VNQFLQRKLRLACFLVGVAALSLSIQGTVRAEPSTGGFEGVPGSTLICVKTGIPFVWLRNAPSSYAPPVMTLYPQDYQKLVTTQTIREDNIQWWVLVQAFPSATSFGEGWVEANSLTTRCGGLIPLANAPAHSNWNGKTVCIKPGVPFVWERTAPSSYAPSKNTIAYADCAALLTPIAAFQQFSFDVGYYWDGAQWWVHLGAPPRVSSFEFWIEMNSLYPSS